MSYTSLSVAQCVEGRRDDFTALALEAMKLFERHGARHVRMLGAMTAGKLSQTHLLMNEFDNAEDYGRFVDSLYHDAEMDALLQRIESPTSPMRLESRYLTAEIPMGRAGSTDHGRFVEIYLADCRPGRFEDLLDVCREMAAYLEGHGATNFQMSRLEHAGRLTGMISASCEWANLAAWGAATDKWNASEDADDMRERMAGINAPFTITWSGIFRDLHI